jgi:hypothetical protein
MSAQLDFKHQTAKTMLAIKIGTFSSQIDKSTQQK